MISLNNISFAYKNSPAIFTDFSLRIEKGSLFGLLGPNGAGKTSLISLIAGLYTPNAGSIDVAGHSLAQDRHAILNKIALVPQEYAFYEQLTAMENCHFFASLYPSNKDSNSIAVKIDNAISLTGLETYRDRKAGTYSGGLKRRLNLAIGLLNTPEILILDEPTVGIDPQSRRFILDAIQELNNNGTTIIYTSHYMTEIEQLCNDIAIIDHGKILRQGSLTHLLGDSLAVDVTLNRSLNDVTLTDDIRSYFKNNEFVITDKNLRSTNFIDADVANLLELLAPLEQQGIAIERLHYGANTLEDVFFDLTKTDLRD